MAHAVDRAQERSWSDEQLGDHLIAQGSQLTTLWRRRCRRAALLLGLTDD
jgi:hypothetical protein